MTLNMPLSLQVESLTVFVGDLVFARLDKIQLCHGTLFPIQT